MGLFGGKERPPAQDPMGGPIQYDREGRPTDMPMEPTMGGFGDIMGGFIDMMFPPAPHEEEERRRREMHEEQADLSPESGLESNEEIERKNRLIDVEKTDERFEEAHGQITQEGERAWEELRMKYLDMGGFNYANQVEALIEAHRIPEPVDAVWEWSEWTDCRNGKQSRTTKLISNARFGGTPYEPQKEEQECEMPPEPIDCVMGEWTAWTDCMDGEQSRRRMEAVFPQHGGKPCSEYRYEVRECVGIAHEEEDPVEHPAIDPEPEPEPEPAPTPIDCELSAWSSWTECDRWNTQGIQRRTRYVQTQAQFGGKECEGPLEEERPCEPIDCVMGEWGEWEDCFHQADGTWLQRRKRRHRDSDYEWPYFLNGNGIWGGNSCDDFRDVEWRTCPNPPVEEPAQDSTPDTTSETPSPAEQPASSGGGGGQTNLNVTITTESKEETETTTEEPEEDSNALKIVGGLAVLSGICYWAYQKYA